jgi:hypothetical protein
MAWYIRGKSYACCSCSVGCPCAVGRWKPLAALAARGAGDGHRSGEINGTDVSAKVATSSTGQAR